MRSLFLISLLAACEPAMPKTRDSADDTSAPSESLPTESLPTESQPSDDSSPPDTGTPPCEGIRLIQSVTYNDLSIYDIAAVPNGFAVSRPEMGDGASGIIDVWTLDQGDALERALDAPSYTVTGPDLRAALGVTVWRSGDNLCSQDYGVDAAGTLYCWPATDGGVVSEIATTTIPGATPGAYYGYGFTMQVGFHDVTRAWDANLPGAVTDDVGLPLFEGACGEQNWCQQGAQIGDVVAFISDDGGFVYGHDADTGELLWTTDTGGYAVGPTYIHSLHGLAFLVSSASSAEGTQVLDVTTGIASWSTYDYAAGYAEGVASDGRSIEVLSYDQANSDGSTGGFQVWDRNNNTVAASLAALLGLDNPRLVEEHVIRLVAMDIDGYYAFATWGSNYAGVIEVCSVPE